MSPPSQDGESITWPHFPDEKTEAACPGSGCAGLSAWAGWRQRAFDGGSGRGDTGYGVETLGGTRWNEGTGLFLHLKGPPPTLGRAASSSLSGKARLADTAAPQFLHSLN